MSDSISTNIQVDSFRSADAPGIAQLFRAVYGDGYPVKTYYDPVALTQANETGDIISTVARTETGEVVGHEAWYRSAPYKKLYEAGTGLVSPAYRNQGLMKRLLDYSLNVDIQRANAEETFGEAVCNHLAMQKAVYTLGYCEFALEVDLMPAQAYTQEQSAQGRVSTLLMFKTIIPKPHTVYLPVRYRNELSDLVTDLSGERTIVWSENDLQKDSATRIKMDIFDSAQVARIAVHFVGADFAAITAGLEDEVRAKNVVVFQMWLPLSSPSINTAVDILRARDYFFGGYLPRWFDEDGLLMQKVLGEPNWDGINLLTDRAKRIASLVKQDWLRTQSD